MERRADGDALRLKFGSLKLFDFASQSHDSLFQTALPIPNTSLRCHYGAKSMFMISMAWIYAWLGAGIIFYEFYNFIPPISPISLDPNPCLLISYIIQSHFLYKSTGKLSDILLHRNIS